MKSQQLRNKRILISGITGFVGTALSGRLSSLGAHVIGISRSIQTDSIYKIDITNFAQIKAFIKKHQIECCIHLAGESIVESGQTQPFETFSVNTQSTLNLLESSRVMEVERIIIASTSHVYGKNVVPYKEYYPPKPSRPYETSKACTDMIADSYADTFNLPVMIGRFVNIYGPGDKHFTRLIPKTIQSVFEGNNPEMWGGNAVREYLYLDDAIDAYLKLLEVDISSIGKNRIFNFGSGETYTVREVIEKILTISHSSLAITKIQEQRGSEINAQYVSSQKAKRMLGWEANISIENGLEQTIAWYNEYLQNK